MQYLTIKIFCDYLCDVLIESHRIGFVTAIPHLQGQPRIRNEYSKIIVSFLWWERVGPALGFCLLLLLIRRFDFILPSVCGPLCRFSGSGRS